MNRFLSLFIKDKLWIGSFCLIRAYHYKIHVCKNPKASFSAKFRFQLVSQIGRLVIQKFYTRTVWKPVRKINIASNKGV